MHLDPTRLAIVSHLPLAKGAHPPQLSPESMCVMEAVAYVAGEPWSDHPACASAVIAEFLRRWNDDLPDADRTRLLTPLIPRLVGTKGTAEQEQRRSYMALDWLIRTYTPAWLDLCPSLAPDAAALRGLAEIVDMRAAVEAAGPVRAAQANANSVADAAWAAAREAAWEAALEAAWAAREAAWAAEAAWSSSAADVLLPTQTALQASALALIDRMIAVTE